ncbi:MAG: CDP-alcohol phosphatidyltransferase family protein, partial [Christensenellales bacterium]
DLGKLLDPIADKVLVLSALLMVTFDGTIQAPFGVIALLIIIARDYVVDAIRQISASKGVVIPADIWGKMKTLFTMIALMLLILYSYLNSAFALNETFMYIILVLSLTIFAISVLLTILSGCNYLIKNRNLFVANESKKANNSNDDNDLIEQTRDKKEGDKNEENN